MRLTHLLEVGFLIYAFKHPGAPSHSRSARVRAVVLAAACLLVVSPRSWASGPLHDVVVHNGIIYDGSGAKPYRGEIAVDGDRIAYVGPKTGLRGRAELDAQGQAVAPGFINMLSHTEDSLLVDGRALSDLVQGVTLEVLGESSMGPLNDRMKQQVEDRQGDIKFKATWSTLGGYFDVLNGRGIAPNVASFVGANTVRDYVLGERDIAPTPEQLDTMVKLVHQSMEEGALGLTTALVYAPATYAKSDELIALASESARCGGIYTVHMRNEGDRIEAAVQETIDVAKASGAPAEIYHLKMSGRDNWNKLDRVIGMVDQARKAGIRISANMYTYTAGASGLDVSMPPWVQDGGLETWISNLKKPDIRARVIAEMRNAHPADWDSLYGAAGPENILLLAFKNPALKPLTGMRLSDVARQRGVSPEDAAIDLVIEDGTRVGVAYFLMNENNVRRQTAIDWVSFGSDGGGAAPEGVFLLLAPHPRTYGNFARLLAKYVREEHALSLEYAIHKLTMQPADNLSLVDRGRLKKGAYADIVIFDPLRIQDHATFDHPHQLATGVSYVLVNGKLAVEQGHATGAATGRVVKGRAWSGASGGGCRASAKDWSWVAQPSPRS